MSAQSLQITTIVLPDPDTQLPGTSTRVQQISGSLAYSNLTSFDIRTLSTQGATVDVRGLLYTPDLGPDDPCTAQSAPYVPKNVTRQANLPNADYDMVALVPWVSPNCTLSYMKASNQDITKGFLIFVPGNDTSIPPEANAEVWNFGGNDDWKEHFSFPVYAIPGQFGTALINQSALYSGNISAVPNGDEIEQQYDADPRSYVRLLADIDTGGAGDSLPSLWVFLLVVLGILLAIIGLTSLTMHWLQRRRRQSLRRRVANGEVDLEALGIKRLTVPQEVLDDMPLYIYGTGQPVSPSVQKQTAIAVEKLHDSSESVSSPTHPAPTLLRTGSYRPTPLSQPTCAICLDDFVPASPGNDGTTVRELPCHHIFHPECVDTFLRDSSSLCPMCKKTALPKGYCPRVITNAMVRRERMVRQIRERVPAEPVSNGQLGHDWASPLTRIQQRYTQLRTGRRISSAPVSNSQQMQELESDGTARPALERSNSTSASGVARPVRPQVQPSATASRREWARQRAINMLGPRAPEDPETEEARRTPRWRKAMRGLFPGLQR